MYYLKERLGVDWTFPFPNSLTTLFNRLENHHTCGGAGETNLSNIRLVVYREKVNIIQQLNVVEKLHNELCFDFVLSNLKNNVDPLCVPNSH